MADADVVRELTDKLENGMKALFESDKYAEYLKTMSRFHKYSTRNISLIHLQDPEAQQVGGYQFWQREFNRHVKKGEHGIKIYAPVAGKGKDIEVEKLDPITKQAVLDEHGQPIMERLSPTSDLRVRFKLVTVFSERQTEGAPLPEIAETLTGDVERFELFVDALRAVSPLPIVFETMTDKDGYCAFGNKIGIREGMSQTQTIAAIIHEIAHSKVHDENSIDGDYVEQTKREKEVTAESIAYVVSQKFGVETGANSFGYIGSYLKSKEAKELQASLDTIRKTAAKLIDGIDERYKALAKERGIDLTIKPPLAAAEMSVEQNYNRLSGVINNETPKIVEAPVTLEESEQSETDTVREKLAVLSEIADRDAKYEAAAAILVDALCANEQLLALAHTGADWQRGAGRSAVFNGDYYETLIGEYIDELADLLADKSIANKLNNVVTGEVYRRLDEIAYDRYILDEYADVTKSGRLETYLTPYMEDSENKGVRVHLTERLSDGDKHDYGAIFSYDPGDTHDHAINNYFSLIDFNTLRESVFGKSETSVKLDYKETEPVGSTVLRRLLFNDMNFNRELKRTRVEVLPPMGKYSVYAEHPNGVIGDDTTIHIGTDSGFLLPLNVSRTNFEKRYFEAYIDRMFEKADAQLDAMLANPEKFAMYPQAAMAGRIDETEKHNKAYKAVKAEKDSAHRAEIAEQQAAAKKEAKRQHIEEIKSNAETLANGGRFEIETSRYSGKNNLLELFALYDIDVPLATKGWFNNKLTTFETSKNGGFTYWSKRNKDRSKSLMGDTGVKKLTELRTAVQTTPVAEKLALKGVIDQR